MNDLTRNGTDEREDLALATLYTVASEGDDCLPPNLVEKLYRLQKRHQFDVDRAVSVQEMQRLLEQYVDSLEGGTPQ
ncbi:hypothetical protein QP575_01795 [Alcaligenes faecalis subsp. phenolicus]|uniref:hypothetical protein n=1 Tax=Alcaligenes nematophilus TaxID=2994643 RepID=UPI002AA465C9|nr:hypothetical protein [Alcaligenes phenolicus]